LILKLAGTEQIPLCVWLCVVVYCIAHCSHTHTQKKEHTHTHTCKT